MRKGARGAGCETDDQTNRGPLPQPPYSVHEILDHSKYREGSAMAQGARTVNVSASMLTFVLHPRRKHKKTAVKMTCEYTRRVHFGQSRATHAPNTCATHTQGHKHTRGVHLHMQKAGHGCRGDPRQLGG